MTSLLAYGAYLPHARLSCAEIGAALGAGGRPGRRSVASYDEDVSSMGVAAARIALRTASVGPDRLYFATSVPPYLDKTNAAVIHAALELDRGTLAVDMGGAPRSAIGALLAAADASVPTLAVLADMRTGLPGSTDERDGGDAAAALLFGPATAQTPELARILSTASTTDEFLERWRTPGSSHSRIWEERFGEQVYKPLGEQPFSAALNAADLSAGHIDHLIVSGLASRAVTQFRRNSGVRTEALVADHTELIGNPGAAQPGLLLTDVLDRALPGQTIALVHLADGATVIILQVGEGIAAGRPQPTVAAQLAAPGPDLPYPTFLSWRGFLDREPPRRPEPDAPAGPPSHRSVGYKYGFRASRCQSCNTVNVPPSRVCFSCGAIDTMIAHAMQDVLGTVVTMTVDRLAFTPSPPMVAVVIDFDGGGRFRCELADGGPDDAQIGSRVELTFRRLLTANGIHNYFWKARPVRTGGEETS